MTEKAGEFTAQAGSGRKEAVAAAARPPGRRLLPTLLAACCPTTLRGKQMALTIGLFALFIWALALISMTVLRGQIEALLSEQQFAIARHIASELDTHLKERIDNLVATASRLPPDLDARSLEPYLMERYGSDRLFPGGVAVVAPDGRAIADYPVAPGRRGSYLGDREHFQAAVATRRPYVGDPIMGRSLARPIVVIAVPVFDGAGGLRAVLEGVVDLTVPSFLGNISDPSLPGKSEFVIASLRNNTILAATDSRRMMSEAPAAGANPLYDRFRAGFEGSGIATANGTTKLYSGKRVPIADWIVVATLPTEVVFRPVAVMQGYLVAFAVALTLIAFFAIGWLTRRTLAPLEAAGAAMRQMTGGMTALQPLPIRRDDEIGELVKSFNLLVEDRRGHEAALAESEQRFRQLVESAPYAIYIQTRGCFAYVNKTAVNLFGAGAKDELLGRPVQERLHPDFGPSLSAGAESLTQREERFLRLDGSPVDVEVSAVPFRYGGEDGALVFVKDITERKAAHEALRTSEARLAVSRRKLRELSAHNESLLEEERRSIAREIHDELGQLLTALKMDCALLRRKYPEDSYLQDKIDDMRTLLDNTIGLARHVVSNLRPPALDHGIIPAIEWLAEDFSLRWETACQLELDADDIGLDDARATALFRIVQESLTNVARHALASEVLIALRREGSQLQLCIRDNGVGFDHAVVAKQKGFGLHGMRERALALDGNMRISSAPGCGTILTVEIPL